MLIYVKQFASRSTVHVVASDGHDDDDGDGHENDQFCHLRRGIHTRRRFCRCSRHHSIDICPVPLPDTPPSRWSYFRRCLAHSTTSCCISLRICGRIRIHTRPTVHSRRKDLCLTVPRGYPPTRNSLY